MAVQLNDILSTVMKKGYSNDGIIERAYEAAKSFCPAGNDIGIEHNLAVAKTLADIGLDSMTISAGLLHNALQCGYGIDKVRQAFGDEIAGILEQRNRFDMSLLQRSNNMDKTKKLMLSLTSDIRLIFLELAERFDILRRIDELPYEERTRLLEEIRQIYLPVAQKLGIYQLTATMEDLLFMNTDPDEYNLIKSMIEMRISEQRDFVAGLRDALEEKLEGDGIPSVISERSKGVYSTYNKMRRKSCGFEGIKDISGLRVITDTIEDCYCVLGIVNTLGEQLPEDFDDYISKPKHNGYQSIHIVIGRGKGDSAEVQIRTREMHDVAEFGIAAHWRYKSVTEFGHYDTKFTWLREILEWQKNVKIKGVKSRIGAGNTFVFTPKGDLIELPTGSNTIDFAYSIHSDLGDKCCKARVNGKDVSLEHVLENADVVEIITSPNHKPKSQWLNTVKTDKAKQKIRVALNIKEKPVKQKPLTKAMKIGEANSRIRLAKCCSPLPGDDITAFATTKRKISVHVSSCPESQKLSATKKKVDVDWGKSGLAYSADLVVIAKDRIGILRDLLNVLSADNIYVGRVGASAKRNYALCSFEIKIKGLEQLREITGKLHQVSGVSSVKRGSI
jgi:GTP pyrophosphokinase